MVQNKQEELAVWRGVPIKPDQKEIYVLLMVQRRNVAAMRGAPTKLMWEEYAGGSTVKQCAHEGCINHVQWGGEEFVGGAAERVKQ